MCVSSVHKSLLKTGFEHTVLCPQFTLFLCFWTVLKTRETPHRQALQWDQTQLNKPPSCSCKGTYRDACAIKSLSIMCDSHLHDLYIITFLVDSLIHSDLQKWPTTILQYSKDVIIHHKTIRN